MSKQTNWEKYIPWFLTIASSLVLIAIGFFLIHNINWFKDGVFKNEADLNLEYKVYAYQMHLSMIKRSVGLFSGFAIMFLGTGVAFYTLKKENSLNIEGIGITARIVTASPGIIAMVLGTFLIISTINSKDNFPNFKDSHEKPKDIKGPEKGPGRVN
ncbi:hypothetical protein [Flammeovirga agarivorans]|uniref:MotA/TolQ/ExbB proton channel domain-containing protein n=1 Tax=Flammeovirga agarivorans TaxID=2726742 RepID=A0A7X8XVU8_9BACT|nr:hypothetical protein [Flammeovirga agarivorans]NLR91683.1 hypothetical protein [Flammeovirga agarivorans]